MAYNKNTIKEMLDQIRKNELYLPAIQRKFVWEEDQICSLFDSIMRDYPIGTFLYWSVEGKEIGKYTFYKFLQNYHELDHCVNEVAPRPEMRKSIVGVLDGQQRLSSMYIALQGTYASKRRYARKRGNDAYPTKCLYLNLLGNHSDVENEHDCDFQFLAEEDAGRMSDKHLWFKVSDVLTWDDNPDIDARYDELIDARKEKNDKICGAIRAGKQSIKLMLRTLHEKITREEIIHYYKLKGQELDGILDIFIRVNSGGTVLSKTDLLFSTIVANWGEAREEIDGFIDEINDIGDGFKFDNDFIMRSCLVLTDGPVLFKVGSFKKENIQKIREGWDDIKNALRKTVETIAEFGFNRETLTSNNAVIPIAYYFLKCDKDDEQSRRELRRYLVHALLKKVYGARSDQVIASIREALRISKDGRYCLKDQVFSFEAILGSIPGLKIDSDDVLEILESEKCAYTFMALSLLYPSLKFRQVKFHQDHIHPTALFTDAKMKKCGINDASKRKEWQKLKDKLPNLQLMEERENKSKNKTPFKEWFLNPDYVPNRNKYIQDNYLPPHETDDYDDYDIKNFESFYETRKEILRRELDKVLKSGSS